MSWFGLFGSPATSAANAAKPNNAAKANKVNVVTPLPVPNAVQSNASVATPQATVGGRRKSKKSRKSRKTSRKNRK